MAWTGQYLWNKCTGIWIYFVGEIDMSLCVSLENILYFPGILLILPYHKIVKVLTSLTEWYALDICGIFLLQWLVTLWLGYNYFEIDKYIHVQVTLTI